MSFVHTIYVVGVLPPSAERHCSRATTYVVLFTRVTRWGFGGGLPPSKISLFRPCRATLSPCMGEKERFLEGLQPSKSPRSRRPRNSCDSQVITACYLASAQMIG